MHVQSTARRLGDTFLIIYYWDRERDRYSERVCWTPDEQVTYEFNLATQESVGGAPHHTFTAKVAPDTDLEKVREQLFNAVRYSGLYPGSTRTDEGNRSVSVEGIGALTEHRREHIRYFATIEAAVREEELSFSEGGFE